MGPRLALVAGCIFHSLTASAEPLSLGGHGLDSGPAPAPFGYYVGLGFNLYENDHNAWQFSISPNGSVNLRRGDTAVTINPRIAVVLDEGGLRRVEGSLNSAVEVESFRVSARPIVIRDRASGNAWVLDPNSVRPDVAMLGVSANRIGGFVVDVRNVLAHMRREVPAAPGQPPPPCVTQNEAFPLPLDTIYWLGTGFSLRAGRLGGPFPLPSATPSGPPSE